MTKIKNILSKFSYESTAIMVFAISLIAGGINYLFQVVSGRLFSPEIFGQISILISLMGIISALGSSMMKSMAVTTASLEKEKIGKLLYVVSKKTFYLLPIAYLLLGIVSFIITKSLITSILFFLVCFPLVLSYCFEGALQGIGKAIPVQICEVIASASKFVFVLLFLKIGLGQASVPLNSVISNIFILLFTISRLKKASITVIKNKNSEIKTLSNGVYKHYISSLLSGLALTFFNYIDVLSMRMFFSDYEVGQYSAASLFGKIILYIPSALVLILIPTVASSESKTGSLKTLHKTLFYSFSLSFIASIVMCLLKKYLILFLMGDKYLPCLPFFIPSCVMMTALVIYTVILNYELAVADKKFLSIVSVISVITSVLAIVLFHSTIQSCLYALAVVYIVFSAILYIRVRQYNKS